MVLEMQWELFEELAWCTQLQTSVRMQVEKLSHGQLVSSRWIDSFNVSLLCVLFLPQLLGQRRAPSALRVANRWTDL